MSDVVTYEEALRRCAEANVTILPPIDLPRYVTVARQVGSGLAVVVSGAPADQPVVPDLYSNQVGIFTFLVPDFNGRGPVEEQE